MEQLVVYTCIVGGYDNLIRQPRQAGVRYVCFTDVPFVRTAGWEIRPLISPTGLTSPRLINRYHKVLCYDRFPGATESIYVDGNVLLLAPPSVLVDTLRQNGSSIAALPHDVRTTVAEEVQACARKLPPGQAEVALGLYQMKIKDGFPDDLGLSANFLLVRKAGDAALRRSMDRWWHCISTEVERDQLSLQYSLWKEQVDLHFLKETAPGCTFARRLKHGAVGLSMLDRIRLWRQRRHGMSSGQDRSK